MPRDEKMVESITSCCTSFVDARLFGLLSSFAHCMQDRIGGLRLAYYLVELPIAPVAHGARLENWDRNCHVQRPRTRIGCMARLRKLNRFEDAQRLSRLTHGGLSALATKIHVPMGQN